MYYKYSPYMDGLGKQESGCQILNSIYKSKIIYAMKIRHGRYFEDVRWIDYQNNLIYIRRHSKFSYKHSYMMID